MRILAVVVLLVFTAAAHSNPNPITDCRAAHLGDSAAHIACLEEALRARLSAPQATPPAAPAPIAATAATTVAPAMAGSIDSQPTGLGAEQAKARQRPLDAPPEQAEVTIVAVSYSAERLGTFTLSDGQVWRETTPAPARYSLKAGREYPARIESSKIGGYRLYVDGARWMYKVQRLK